MKKFRKMPNFPKRKFAKKRQNFQKKNIPKKRDKFSKNGKVLKKICPKKTKFPQKMANFPKLANF